MNDNENKKTPEELADEAVDAVAGGGPGLSRPGILTSEEMKQLLCLQQEEGQRKR